LAIECEILRVVGHRGVLLTARESACVKALPGNGKKDGLSAVSYGNSDGYRPERPAPRQGPQGAITGARYGGGRIIATARDSWSPTALPRSGLQAPGRAQVQVQVSGQSSARAQAPPRPWGAVPPGGPLPRRVSFSSQPAFSAVPPAASPREPGLAPAGARPPPPGAPTRSAADSRSAQALRRTRCRAGPKAYKACDSSRPTRFSLQPLAARTQRPASRAAEPTSGSPGSASLRNMRPA